MWNNTVDNKTCNLNFYITFDLSDESRERSSPSNNSAELRSRLFSKRSTVAEKFRIAKSGSLSHPYTFHILLMITVAVLNGSKPPQVYHQGSVLGPLLFSLFINDIGNLLRYSRRMIFADDTQIYLSCLPSEINSGIAKIRHDVDVIASYATESSLQLNIDKSKVLVLRSRTFVSRIDLNTLPPIMVEGKTIPFVNEVRNLGVIMTANLSWRSHVMSISKKVHFSLHKLKFHRNASSRELQITFIVSLIFPLIDYCCLVFNDLTNEMNPKLQQLVNCGVRFIFDLRRDVHISPYRRSLGRLSVKSRRFRMCVSVSHSAELIVSVSRFLSA